MLGLAQRAGKLISGDERVEKAIKERHVGLVILAQDASEKTIHRYQALTKRQDIPLHLAFNRLEISQSIGKKRTVCAIQDRGMTKKFLSYTMKEEGL